MKKTFIAAALIGTMLLTGCSGVSQEEYNSLLSENKSLKNENSELESVNSSLKSENESGSLSTSIEQEKNIIDYDSAESFEKALNDGKNLEGKIVRFVAGEFHPDSSLGYNVWAGEHLNFISANPPGIQEGDTVIIKVTNVENHFGSWIIKYEKMENAAANNGTESSEDSSASKTNNSSQTSTASESSSQPQPDVLTEVYKKENFIVGAKKFNDWYYKEKESGSIEAVLYVGDFSEIKDVDKFASDFYAALYSIILEAPNRGMYTYYVFKENGDCVTATVLAFGVTIPVVWMYDYKPLNDNATAKLFDDIWSGSGKETSSSTESQTSSSQSTATTGERNALKKAQSYLSHSAFSREGLIRQLEYEGYTNSEAIYGADNVGANWNEQALKKAKSYLSHSAFSYSGLIKQLEYEKFTYDQATYGADKCGADWNEQAAKKAKSYLSHSSFSKDGLIRQLEYEGFTYEQAVYGAAQNGY